MALAGVLSGALTGGGLANMLLGIYPPLSTAYSKWAYAKHPNMVPGLADLTELLYRKQIGRQDFIDTAEQNGFSADWADKFFAGNTTLLQAHEYVTLWRRGVIDEGECDDKLSRLRFNAESILQFKRATEFFPSPLDLVRFAVREVYTPEIVEKFGQMEDLPGKYIEEAAKAGLPVEQAKNYWASHWMLPSPLQGFGMLHRDIVDQDTLKMLLKSLDIMPYWRDRLIQLSYNPLTRVDVRRMHAMGILDANAVAKAYRHGGYSPENADLMAEFTVRYNADEGTGLTRASVQKAYKIGLITVIQLKSYLESFGYSEDVVEYWLMITEYEKSLLEIEAYKTELFRQYRKGLITIEDIRQALYERGLPATYVEQAIDEETKTPSLKIKMPTRTDLTDWLLLQIIDEEYFVEQMRAIGYRQQDIEFYLTQAAFEVDTSKRKFLPIKTYQRWLQTAILGVEDFTRISTIMGYSEDDIGRLIIEVGE
ncbi:hypothetical protein ES705_26741 [subsurface metagenome]